MRCTLYRCLKEELIYFEDCVDFTFLLVEKATFTPAVFSNLWSIGRETDRRMVERMSAKRRDT